MKMARTTLFFLFDLSIYIAAVACERQTVDTNQSQDKLIFAIAPNGYGTASRTIHKRAMIGPAAVLMRMISAGTQIYSRRPTRIDFELVGDAAKAIDDFYAFKPASIKKRKLDGGFAITGWSGDLHLVYRAKGRKGNPLLDVIDMRGKDNGARRYETRFIYQKSVDN